MRSQAIHTLDLALQFTGAVSQVSAFCATSGLHNMEAEDFVTAGLRFANGALGNLFASTALYPGRSEYIRLHFDHVSMQLETNLLRLQWHDGHEETIGGVSDSGAGADPMAFTSDWHRQVIADFCEAVAKKAELPLSARSALPVHALIGALEQSAKNGSPVSLSN